MEFRVPIRRYAQEVIVLSVQPFLGRCWVNVSEDVEDYVVSFKPRTPEAIVPTVDEYSNCILEAAFSFQRARDTAQLRALLLAKALSGVVGC